jgi:hypothetical protein
MFNCIYSVCTNAKKQRATEFSLKTKYIFFSPKYIKHLNILKIKSIVFSPNNGV